MSALRLRPDAVATASRRQDGIGLIEVLVALVVISFGVLGMAGLQLTGMKHSSGGFNRAKALLVAENMATRMRINSPSQLPTGSWTYDGFDSGADPAFCAAQPVPYCQATDGGAAASCTSAQFATFDVFSVACGDWGGGVAGTPIDQELPAGRLRVDCDASPCAADSTWTIAVEWKEGSTTSADPDKVDERIVTVKMRP